MAASHDPSRASLPHPPCTGNTLLKLPTNKFTVREREMLIGSKILPPEFFQAATNPFVIGISGREFALIVLEERRIGGGNGTDWHLHA